MDKKIVNHELIFKALSDKQRLKIISLVCNCECEICKCSYCGSEILESLEISQGTLSYHMNILVNANLVIANKIKNTVYYKLNKETLNSVSDLLKSYSDIKCSCE